MSSDRTNEVAPNGTSFDLIGPEHAPVLCLIHGLGLSRELWGDYLPELTKHHRVLNYDLYGHGESAPPPEKASLSVYAEQIVDLMDHLRIASASIIGFSIGGMINRRFAMDFPEKLDDLIILNSPHDRGDEAQELVESRAKTVRDQGAMATIDDALMRWFTPSYLANGDGPDKVRLWRSRVDSESYAQAAWVLANGVRELIEPETPVVARTLVMTCENDSGSTPKMSEDISAEIALSKCLIVPELQHLGLMEQPSFFLKPILEFLEGK